MPSPSVSDCFSLLNKTRLSDKFRLKRRLQGLNKIADENKRQRALEVIADAITTSIELKTRLTQQRPKVEYPDGLPVSEHVEQIKAAIEQHQVVIIAGETGSGKTTQIPKICLELGRGVEGMIGHTQPRRIAARTVANRIAEELHSKLGDVVGYKVRFTDQVSERSYIKLMTDGILLAEMQKDRLLRQYDTIIIDEAHERSLNIDFILGYLKQILSKRPDLKVIITSATIDPQRFSEHFNQAPVIEVSGRTYPVDIHYQPLSEQDDYISGIIGAVEDLQQLPPGDILVFLNGEREIRDAAAALEKEQFRNTHILPLFSRLTVAEQNKIFAPHTGTNIVLSTNVAETSLTVPGIRYVIDTGTARISRYSYRTKVQRLPIEPISQASANQRAGRCGRVAEGVCIRLYSEEDFLSRPEFTDPEILRTNLATVILQMLALDLGNIAQFPFVQPPDQRNINDGVRLLLELDAISETKSGQNRLTSVGRNLARFPIDPRLAKMLLTGCSYGCSQELAIITAGLTIQDPRERPMEKQQAADQQHSRFKDKQSDFISLLNLWAYIQQQQKLLSNNQFRNLCKKQYLSYLRIREWQDIVSQLRLSIKEIDLDWSDFKPRLKVGEENGHMSLESVNQDAIHQAILSGLLSHLGNLDENREYQGARNSRFFIFPGSGLAKKTPKWLMAAELVETSRLFARFCARIDVTWVEPLATHLVKRSYFEPHWDSKQGAVMAYEQVSLYGLVIVPKRRVNYTKIDPDTCRMMFIRHALVMGESRINEAFLQRNRGLIQEIIDMEDKSRRREFLVDEEQLVDFYLQRIPEHIADQITFLSWWKKAKKSSPDLLVMSQNDVLQDDSDKLNIDDYPTVWHQDNLMLPVSYHFDPGSDDDGVSINIPIAMLNQVQDVDFDWLIPALRLEKITALIKGLPKQVRKNFVPAPNYANACLQAISPDGLSLTQAMAKHLLRMSGIRIDPELWNETELADHLRMNFKVVNDNGKLLGQGRDLEKLKQQLQSQVKRSIKSVADKGIEQQHITEWGFGSLPKSYQKKTANITIQAFPALVDHGKDVAIELFETEQQAKANMLQGVARLVLLSIPSPIKYLEQKLPNKSKLGLYFNPFGKISDLLSDCIHASARAIIAGQGDLPYDENTFLMVRDKVRAEIADTVLNSAIKLEQILSLHHKIQKQLKGNLGLAAIQSHGDIKNQLSSLVYKGFVTDCGIDKLEDLKRYLKGIERRLEKLPIDPNQDRLKLLEVEKAESLIKTLETQSRKSISPEILAELRWMLEEFRISLFAQNLGTVYPISFKRIKNRIAELQST
ncbi:ATP-dependent RNA helicase HrpA [Thalassotalea mangrovi]|uniref:ATP-dependent RNA helicase HrpA n=1 Tax=Thalassotalea mangrovi TaxID=2572245 RepID=A0A4U1B4P5_9GAMM|nr:ATP-dependent RNA helicase HrpA [Thalassotalea mangrovi]TKB44761.1 ATP-dependent RNA helicase HrpA [Thalassotalea mangrovi]